MKFLCLLTTLLISSNVIAQETASGLFPELNRRTADTEEASAQPKSVLDNQTIGNTNQLGATDTVVRSAPSLYDKPVEVQRKEEEERIRRVINRTMGLPEDNTTVPIQNPAGQNEIEEPTKAEKGFFVFSPRDVNMVVPTLQRFQYCMSQLSLTNYTDAELKELSVILKYRSVDIPYRYKGLQIGARKTGKIALGGEACQALRSGPGITVRKCVATRKIETENGIKEVPLSEEECKSKVKYVHK